jgi:hypothetical protein
MTLTQISIRPQSSLLYILDPEQGELPPDITELVAAPATCLAFGTLSQHDGATDITVVDAGDDAAPTEELTLAWSGVICTPSGCLALQDVLGQELIRRHVGREAGIELWVNHDLEPDAIVCVIDSGVR